MQTRMPAATKRRAAARPIPEAPPVTTATAPGTSAGCAICLPPLQAGVRWCCTSHQALPAAATRPPCPAPARDWQPPARCQAYARARAVRRRPASRRPLPDRTHESCLRFHTDKLTRSGASRANRRVTSKETVRAPARSSWRQRPRRGATALARPRPADPGVRPGPSAARARFCRTRINEDESLSISRHFPELRVRKPIASTPARSLEAAGPFPYTQAQNRGGRGMASGLMSGKRGLVMGVANDKSIAWGIAQACHEQGASLAFTYQGEALGKRVQPLAASVGSEIVLPCDVTDEASLDAAFATLGDALGRPRLPRPRHRLLRQERAARLLHREHHRGELHPDHADLGLLLHRRRAARREADAERRVAAHPHLLRRREGDAALQRHGRRQGRARGERQVHGDGPRPARHPGQRALRRPDQDAGRRAASATSATS